MTPAEYTARWAARKKAEDPDAWRVSRNEAKGRWRDKNRVKCRAHQHVYEAIKRGHLVRPEACEHCAKPCRPEASHDDYSRPLVVEWLCRQCHAKKDTKRKTEAAVAAVLANRIESAGNLVSDLDHDLANQLWQLAAQVRAGEK